MRKATNVFVSYSHDDEEYFKEFCSYLEPARATHGIKLLHDQSIRTGSVWRDEIQKALDSAGVAVLLVSQHYLTSIFIGENELAPTLAAAKQDGLTIFWICLEPCTYELTEIEKYQAARDPKSPLRDVWNDSSMRGKAFVEICNKLLETIKEAGANLPLPDRIEANQAKPDDIQRQPENPDYAPPDIAPPASVSTGRHALAIGISKYNPKAQLDLKYAADDADAFIKVVEQQQYSVRLIQNEEATLNGIMEELDQLAKRCAKDENPLVVIYFSGHGAGDSQGRHFLIPYDGDPERLFSTTLWNKTLKSALDEIRTDKLVVFLDACHPGVKTPEGAKAPPPVYETTWPGAQPETGSREYVVASCSAGEYSYEDDTCGHALFTKHLLDLLTGEDERLEEIEEIELTDLYIHLRDSVSRVADNKKKGWRQTPWANFNPEVGLNPPVILAYNTRLRKDRAKDRRLSDIIIEMKKQEEKLQVKKSPQIRSEIEQYYSNGYKKQELSDFYELVESVCSDLGSPAEDAARNLLSEYSNYQKRAARASGNLASGRSINPVSRSSTGDRQAAKDTQGERAGSKFEDPRDRPRSSEELLSGRKEKEDKIEDNGRKSSTTA